MSKTTDRILIAVLLIAAVVFVTRDAHAGVFVSCASYAGWLSSSLPEVRAPGRSMVLIMDGSDSSENAYAIGAHD